MESLNEKSDFFVLFSFSSQEKARRKSGLVLVDFFFFLINFILE